MNVQINSALNAELSALGCNCYLSSNNENDFVELALINDLRLNCIESILSDEYVYELYSNSDDELIAIARISDHIICIQYINKFHSGSMYGLECHYYGNGFYHESTTYWFANGDCLIKTKNSPNSGYEFRYIENSPESIIMHFAN